MKTQTSSSSITLLQDGIAFSAGLFLRELCPFSRTSVWVETFWPSTSGDGPHLHSWPLQERKIVFQVWYGRSGLCRAVTSAHLARHLPGPAGISPASQPELISHRRRVLWRTRGGENWIHLIGLVAFSRVWTRENQEVNQVLVRKAFKGPRFSSCFFFFLKSEGISVVCQSSDLILSFFCCSTAQKVCTNKYTKGTDCSPWWVATPTASHWLRPPQPASFPYKHEERLEG